LIQENEEILNSCKEADPKKTLLQIISQFVETFKASINGMADIGELCGGARIQEIFHEKYGKTLSAQNALDGLKEGDILAAICNANGVNPGLFIHEVKITK